MIERLAQHSGARPLVRATLVLFLLFVALLWASPALLYAEPELDGLVMAQTMTPVGREFYRQFCAQWEGVPGFKNYSIVIGEKADARWGSLIIITVNDMIVYRKLLGMRLMDMKDAAHEAVEIVGNYVFGLAFRENQLKDGDLKDEQPF